MFFITKRTRRLGRLSTYFVAACGCALSIGVPGTAAIHRTDGAAYLVVARQRNGPVSVEALSAHGRLLRVLGRVGADWSGPPAWSSDRKRALWFGPRGLTIASIGGGGQRILAPIEPQGCTADCAQQSFDLSPDGRTVLVDGVGPLARELATVSVSTGRMRTLARGADSTDYAVAGWSPDGKSILYVRILHRTSPENDLVLARPDGSHARVVLRLRNAIAGPEASWAPNGHEIAFFEQSGSNGDGHTRIGVLDLVSGRVHVIRISTSSQSPPVWAPDSRHLALSGTYGRTFILSPNGAVTRRFSLLSDRLLWTRSGLYLLRGPQDTTVDRSANGVRAPQLLFTQRQPGSIVSFAPRS